MFTYLIWEIVAGVIGIFALGIIVVRIMKKTKIAGVLRDRAIIVPAVVFACAVVAGLIANRSYPPNFAMPLFMHSHAPGGLPASIPWGKMVEFITHKDAFAEVADIGADPNTAPSSPKTADADGIVRFSMTAKEVISEIADGITFNYWTYDGQVPGPMLRVREGDTVELTLTNDPSSLHPHNIDLHAVTGQGGGASLTNVKPGESKTFRWKALNPGLYIYHCATPNVSTHNSHGQYGLIMVDPIDLSIALTPVDKEFYVVQGELYTMGQLGKKGLVPFDSEALLAGNPNYVTFNGRIETTPRMQAKVGERIRMYVGNGGVNLISSFHVIGEIFDVVYPEGAIGTDSSVFKNVQTTAVLPGGSSIVEFIADVPGTFLLVDHALARMNKGAWAVLEVTGAKRPDLYGPVGASDTQMDMHTR